MIIAIIAFYTISVLMMAYCTDYPSIPSGIDLTMPSIRDLEYKSDEENIDVWKFRQIADSYVEDVIRPATLYFIYHNRISKETDSGTDLLKLVAYAFGALPMFFFFSNKLKKIELMAEWEFLRNTLGGIITAVICIVIILIIFKLYDNFWSIPKLIRSEDDLKRAFNRIQSKYPICENRAFMNYVIMLYYRYLSSHYNDIERKKTTLHISCTIGTIAWFALMIWTTI